MLFFSTLFEITDCDLKRTHPRSGKRLTPAEISMNAKPPFAKHLMRKLADPRHIGHADYLTAKQRAHKSDKLPA